MSFLSRGGCDDLRNRHSPHLPGRQHDQVLLPPEEHRERQYIKLKNTYFHFYQFYLST